jgi:hypothetical protein
MFMLQEKIDSKDKNVADNMMDELEALMNTAKSSYVFLILI